VYARLLLRPLTRMMAMDETGNPLRTLWMFDEQSPAWLLSVPRLQYRRGVVRVGGWSWKSFWKSGFGSSGR